jgi:hypothetical protein
MEKKVLFSLLNGKFFVHTPHPPQDKILILSMGKIRFEIRCVHSMINLFISKTKHQFVSLLFN